MRIAIMPLARMRRSICIAGCDLFAHIPYCHAATAASFVSIPKDQMVT